jgi:hypothetical protein
MNNLASPPKRSIKLSQDEKKALKNYCKTFQTEVDCALAIGIDRNVLARVRHLGSGSEITITRIRETLQRAQI